nr:hypothetical protein [Enterocloster bolteae]
MAQKRPRDQRVVRNRRVAIYTFLLILTLFYISAHRTVQKEREMEALRAETAAEGPGEQVKELAEGWPEEVVGGQTGGSRRNRYRNSRKGCRERGFTKNVARWTQMEVLKFCRRICGV